MARHEKKLSKTDTQAVPIIIPVHGTTIPAPGSRVAKDIKICDLGWNNTEEGRENLANAAPRGKHAK